MKQTAVMRTTGEICFYFSVLFIFSTFEKWLLPLSLFTAACFGLGLFIVRCQSKWLRLLLSLLPGLCFLIGPLDWLLLFPCVAWLYYILVMVQGNWAMPLEEYRKTYTVMMVICLFFIAGNIANSTIYRGNLISIVSLVYAFLFLFMGVVAMRRMQMGAEMSRGWKLSNAVSVAGFPLLAIGVSVLLFLFLRFTQPAVKFLLTPVGNFILWLFNLLFPNNGSLDDQLLLNKQLKPERNTLPFGPSPSGNHSNVFDEDSLSTSHLLVEKAASIGAYVVLGILLLLALYLIVKHVRRNQPLPAEGEVYYDESEAASVKRQRRGKKTVGLGNARQLRRIYQTYLEFVNTKGMSIGKADTSQEILDRAKAIQNRPEAERLRELYIAARYGDPDAVTREQVEEAQSCLETIVKNRKTASE